MGYQYLVLFLFAFFLRLVNLHQSFWLDEAITANAARLPLLTIATQFSPADFHPPLYYFLLHFWGSVFGFSTVSLRFPSVIASLLTGFYLYRLALQLQLPPSLKLTCLTFYLFNPLVVYYSQEARMYSLATLFLTAAFYHYFCLIGSTSVSSRHLYYFNLFSLLSFLTFYGSVFFLASLAIFLILKRRFRLVFSTSLGLLLAIIIVSPLLYQQILHSRSQISLIPNWRLVLGTVSPKNLLLIPLKFSLGRLSFNPKILYYSLGIFWSALVFSPWLKLAFSRSRYLFFFFTPLFLAVLFSLFSPMIQYFRFLYLLPLMALILALSASNRIYSTILSFGFLLFTCLYLFSPSFHREDWYSLTHSLPLSSRVYLIPSFADPLIYYRPDLQIVTPATLLATRPSSLFLIPYGQEIHGRSLASEIGSLGYTQTNITNFRGLSLSLWQLK